MLTVGDAFPPFHLSAVEGGPRGLDRKTAFTTVSEADESGRWKVFLFWAKDFSFLCGTETESVSALVSELEAAGYQPLKVSPAGHQPPTRPEEGRNAA